MRSDRTEIEIILNNGKKILDERPELVNMGLGDVIDELDDGTQEMIRDRWGVAAWIVIRRIEDWENKKLVEQLSKIESGPLTYEYVGYLLQSEYGIELEGLLLEAEQISLFDKVVQYVSINLRFQTEIHQQHILPFLLMLENHLDHNSYYSLVTNYADGIAACGAHLMVGELLGELSSKVQYDLIRHLRWDWYSKNTASASTMMDLLFKYRSTWSKKAAVDFLEVGLDYNKSGFQKYFLHLENMLAESNELWLHIIPVFVKYVLAATNEDIVGPIYPQVVEHLRKIPTGAIGAKCSFLETIQWKDGLPENLQNIFETIISSPFSENQCPLNLLDHYVYRQMRKGNWATALSIMQKVFCANRYRQNYSEFFHGLGSSTCELSKSSVEMTTRALDYMLADDVDQVFFGLGLLMNLGALKSDLPLGRKFTEVQLIRLMKPLLYFSVDGSKICHIAFRLLELSEGEQERYLAFCMDEVYGNYPSTMFNASAHYKTSGISAQICLVEMVTKAHEQTLIEYEHVSKIKDLHPSWEHQYIYRRAQLEQNKQINKRANDQSFFTRFFSSRTLKYGVRSAHIVTGQKSQKFYQVAPYQQFKHEMELPAIYINDPVGFAMRRSTYLKEVMHGAVDN